ncbi:TerB family tellurite resistance protein [Parasedimentitalea maritima]|uniref:TerB family tellurite resistance protein n=1 Tax=Parasedimentitalea maritima TaxID=2578117 RepID=A0A5R8YVJ9_9RHOB|nr:TerB family tellurite resistance protein [Zongyanglinia marina]KAE9627544.1 TerB family tellurite resistance protein [Zongyanglinia marina]TLP57509.1 TerB family tellurite resistance protein [Zongyanglinia marina]
MFKDLLNKLLQPIPSALDPQDARLALTALLVRIARSDHNYADVEQDRIDRIIAARYGLDMGGAIILREQAEAMEAEAPDTVRFTRAIKEAVAYEDRIAVIEALWQVVLADGERDDSEDAILRLSANLLGVSDVDSAQARQRMERAL